ncbi:CRISPR-associated RAMP protein, Cmr4 family [human gut metagenome]|uniref:CRISPR-associated RAMP protein, Cmr4 family n=1 Tax=human gut metagenome TaxID=408170 RepID=W1Y9Q1_9ZZZZ
MYKIARPLFFRCITPMHVGCGSDLGIVDLPIQREKHTGYPKIESSGIKGCIREDFEAVAETIEDEINVHKLFGYDEDSISLDKEKIKKLFTDNLQYSGAVGFTDARILLFPVKSVKGVFAWVTCNGVMKKLKEELEITGCNLNYNNEKSSIKKEKAYCAKDCKLIVENADEKDKDEYIVLEEYQFAVEKREDISNLAKELENHIGIENLSQKLVIVSDDDFKDFVTMCTEIVTRTKINNETGAVKDGALFTQEYLPSETIMYDLALFSPTFYPDTKDLDDKDKENLKRLTAEEVKQEFYKEKSIVTQIGAGSTIGKGIVKINKGGK